LLAEELKQKFCTMIEADLKVQEYDFHLRAPGQDTRKYTFRTYDEVMLAVMVRRLLDNTITRVCINSQ
jgi:actin-related protein 8